MCPKTLKFTRHLKRYLILELTIKEGKAIDWSTAESLAFGSLLAEVFVRLSGQDSGRGTLVKDMLY